MAALAMELDYTRYPILVVDDEQDNLDAFRFVFRKSFSLRYAQGGTEALESLDEVDPAVVVTDQRMPTMSGLDLLRRVFERRPDTVGVLLTAYTDLPVLLDAINSGAVYRYVQKPWDSKELTVILRQSIEKHAGSRENSRLREQLQRYAMYLETEQRDPLDFAELATDDPATRAALQQLEALAMRREPLLIVGEAGTEKDLFARAVHVMSSRENGPFVQVACSNPDPEALARQLFGWEPGPSDRTTRAHAGRIELAHGGTLLLSELAELTTDVERGLLELLQSSTATRIGRRDPCTVDVRLLATSSQPATRVAASGPVGRALAEATVEVPPLRDRVGDLPRLAKRLLGQCARRYARPAREWHPEALARLLRYPWPGNMRELIAVVERAVLVCPNPVVSPDYVPLAPAAEGGSPSPADGTNESLSTVDLPGRLDSLERRELCAALERCNGNKAEVARMLGIQRTTLYYRLRRLGIES